MPAAALVIDFVARLVEQLLAMISDLGASGIEQLVPIAIEPIAIVPELLAFATGDFLAILGLVQRALIDASRWSMALMTRS